MPDKLACMNKITTNYIFKLTYVHKIVYDITNIN